MSEGGEAEKTPVESLKPEEEKKYREERLASYEDWLQTLENQVREGKMEPKRRDQKIARAMLARDLLVTRYREQAKRDPLTNLPNKRAFEEKYKGAIRNKVPFGLLLLDLDHFKEVNDEYGHLAGDKVLIQAGLIMATNLRELREEESFDVIARNGGEEFGILLPGIESRSDLEKVAERLRLSFDGNPLFVTIGGEGKNIAVTVSVGGGLYQGEGAEQFFNRVDTEALYLAKNQGRNQTVILPE